MSMTNFILICTPETTTNADYTALAEELKSRIYVVGGPLTIMGIYSEMEQVKMREVAVAQVLDRVNSGLFYVLDPDIRVPDGLVAICLHGQLGGAISKLLFLADTTLSYEPALGKLETVRASPNVKNTQFNLPLSEPERARFDHDILHRGWSINETIVHRYRGMLENEQDLQDADAKVEAVYQRVVADNSWADQKLIRRVYGVPANWFGHQCFARMLGDEAMTRSLEEHPMMQQLYRDLFDRVKAGEELTYYWVRDALRTTLRQVITRIALETTALGKPFRWVVDIDNGHQSVFFFGLRFDLYWLAMEVDQLLRFDHHSISVDKNRGGADDTVILVGYPDEGAPGLDPEGSRVTLTYRGKIVDGKPVFDLGDLGLPIWYSFDGRDVDGEVCDLLLKTTVSDNYGGSTSTNRWIRFDPAQDKPVGAAGIVLSIHDGDGNQKNKFHWVNF